LESVLGCLIAILYLTTKVDYDLNFLSSFLTNNITLPCEFKVVTPHEVWQVGHGLLVASNGGETPGKTIMASSQLSSGNDWERGDAGGKFTIHKLHITQHPQRQRVVRNLTVSGYYGGAGSTFIRPVGYNKCTGAEYNPNNYSQDGSLIVFVVPFNEARLTANMPMSITGSWDQSVMDNIHKNKRSLCKAKHYSTVEFYTNLYNFKNTATLISTMNSISERVFGAFVNKNRICMPAYQQLPRQLSVGVVNMENYVADQGFNEKVGCLQYSKVRRGHQFTYTDKLAGFEKSHCNM